MTDHTFTPAQGAAQPVAWRYTCQDGSEVLMLKPLTEEQKRRGYYTGEDGEDEVDGDEALVGPLHWAQETPLYEHPPQVTEGQWRRVDALPDVGRKFICLWNDGSGAVMYWRHDHGYIDQEGDEFNEIDWLKIDRWAYLPQDLEFWCETRAEDPMALSSTDRGNGA